MSHWTNCKIIINNIKKEKNVLPAKIVKEIIKNIEYTEENFRFWPNYGKWYSKRNDKIYRNNNGKYRYFLRNDQEKESNMMEITHMINDDGQACKNQTIDLLYIDTRILLERLRLIIEIQNQICGYWLSV